MCGIHGFVGKDEERVRAMMRATRHRGPDGEGVFVGDGVTLGHNLLAITETSKNARQPFISGDGQYAMVYNGEIYNYRALREHLQRHGRRFRTDGDTEVLFAGLQEEGAEFLKKIDGMYAVGFYDRNKKTLLLARDSLGMKPLYYSAAGGALAFSSEIRGLLAWGAPRALDRAMVGVYFDLGYVPGGRTLLRAIKKVMPGEVLVANMETGEVVTREVVTVDPEEVRPQSFDVGTFRSLLGSVVRSHTMGLRPWGLYLSGGIDSSVILHELAHDGGAPVTTYTTRFETTDTRYNEDADVARNTAEAYRTDHHEVLIREKDYIAVLQEAVAAVEEPMYSVAVAHGYLLAKEARRNLVVTISGEGGDELLLGYDHYPFSQKLSARLRRYPAALLNCYYTGRDRWRGTLDWSSAYHLEDVVERWQFMRRLRDRRDDPLYDDSYAFGATSRYLHSLAHPLVKNPTEDTENALAALDRLWWLADEAFLRADKLGMHVGMEARFPFAARPLVEYFASIPSAEKMNSSFSKGLLRSAYRDVLPVAVLEKKKTGWTAPVLPWLDSQLGDCMQEVLAPSFYPETSALFRLESLRTLVQTERSRFRGLKKYYPVFAFQLWAHAFRVTL